MQKKPATLREVIGDRVRHFRKAQGWNQDDLAAALGEVTGQTWSRQAVSRLEKGRRAFDAAEILILAKVLGRGISAYQLLVTDDLEAPISLTSAVTIPMKEIHDLVLPALSTPKRGSRGDKHVLDQLLALNAQRQRDAKNEEQLLGYLRVPYTVQAPKQ